MESLWNVLKKKNKFLHPVCDENTDKYPFYSSHDFDVFSIQDYCKRCGKTIQEWKEDMLDKHQGGEK